MGAQNPKTSASAWKAQAYKVIEIDENLAIKIKRLDIMTVLASDGLANNPFMGILLDQMSVGMGSNIPVGKPEDVKPVSMKAIQEFLNTVALDVIVEPKLTTNKNDTDDDVLHIDLMPLDVKQSLFQHIMGGQDLISRVTTFPDGEETSPVVDLRES